MKDRVIVSTILLMKCGYDYLVEIEEISAIVVVSKY